MNIYKVPFDFTHEEKVFGGYLSIRQMLYVVFGVASVGILFLPIIMSIKVLIVLLVFSLFMAFAFLKIQQIYADRYFINILKYLFRKKVYIHERWEKW